MVKDDTRSRYAKYVNFGRETKDKKRDRERSRLPALRFLKHIAKKSKTLREIVYHCVRSNSTTSASLHSYVKVRKIKNYERNDNAIVLKQQKWTKRFPQGILNLKCLYKIILSM